MNFYNQQNTGRMDWGGQGGQVSPNNQGGQGGQNNQGGPNNQGGQVSQASQASQASQVSQGGQVSQACPINQGGRTEREIYGWPMEEKRDTGCGIPPSVILPMDNIRQQMRGSMPWQTRTDMPPQMPPQTPPQMLPQMQTDMPRMNFGNMMGNGMFPLGMSYVPVQEWSQPSPLEEGFNRGTMFGILDLPFMMGRCR